MSIGKKTEDLFEFFHAAIFFRKKRSVDNFSNAFFLSTPFIDTFFTDSANVDNFYRQTVVLVDKFHTPLQQMVYFDIIFVFSLFITKSTISDYPQTVDKMWKVDNSVFVNLSTERVFCRKPAFLLYYIVINNSIRMNKYTKVAGEAVQLLYMPIFLTHGTKDR